MNDFFQRLMSYPKWSDENHVNIEIKKILLECLELKERWSIEIYDKLIDLTQIAKIKINLNLSDTSPNQNNKKLRYLNLNKNICECLDMLVRWDDNIIDKLISLSSYIEDQLNIIFFEPTIKKKYEERFDNFISNIESKDKW